MSGGKAGWFRDTQEAMRQVFPGGPPPKRKKQKGPRLTRQVNLRLTAEAYAALQRLADNDGRTKSGWVRWQIELRDRQLTGLLG